MYFYGRRYLWDSEYSDKNDRTIIDAIGKQFPEIRGARVEEVKAEFKTWRKANQIHKWFVDNIQDGFDECKESHVPVEKLYKLRDLCAEVVADPSRAHDLLPCQSGFFFGSTEYDEWYHRDVKETLDWLNDFLLKDTLDTLKEWDFYYRSSW
jgi:hypothetical protein